MEIFKKYFHVRLLTAYYLFEVDLYTFLISLTDN